METKFDKFEVQFDRLQQSLSGLESEMILARSEMIQARQDILAEIKKLLLQDDSGAIPQTNHSTQENSSIEGFGINHRVISLSDSQLLKTDEDECLSNEFENYVLEVKELNKSKDDGDFISSNFALLDARIEELCERGMFFYWYINLDQKDGIMVTINPKPPWRLSAGAKVVLNSMVVNFNGIVEKESCLALRLQHRKDQEDVHVQIGALGDYFFKACVFEMERAGCVMRQFCSGKFFPLSNDQLRHYVEWDPSHPFDNVLIGSILGKGSWRNWAAILSPTMQRWVLKDNGSELVGGMECYYAPHSRHEQEFRHRHVGLFEDFALVVEGQCSRRDEIVVVMKTKSFEQVERIELQRLDRTKEASFGELVCYVVAVDNLINAAAQKNSRVVMNVGGWSFLGVHVWSTSKPQIAFFDGGKIIQAAFGMSYVPRICFFILMKWKGIVTKGRDVVVEKISKRKRNRYRVVFDNPQEELRFTASRLRFPLDWDHGIWVGPRRQKRMQGLEFSIGMVVEVKLDVENPTNDDWFSATILEEVGFNFFLVRLSNSSEKHKSALIEAMVDSFHIWSPLPRSDVKSYKLLEPVYTLHGSGWRSGFITKILTEGRYALILKNKKKQKVFGLSEIRPHMDFLNGNWISFFEEADFEEAAAENEIMLSMKDRKIPTDPPVKRTIQNDILLKVFLMSSVYVDCLSQADVGCVFSPEHNEPRIQSRTAKACQQQR